MRAKRNKIIGGGAGAILNFVWGIYSTVTTLRDLPQDAGWFAKMIADPPVYAPWLLFAACVIFLAWIFWQRDEDDGDTDISANVSNSGSAAVVAASIGPINHVGDVINQHAAPKFAAQDELVFAPPGLGRKDTIDLAGVAELRLTVPCDNSMVTTILDVVQQTPNVVTSGPIKVTDAFFINTTGKATYVFDTGEKVRHNIAVGEHSFVVTLVGIEPLELEKYRHAKRYKFKIREA